jgi:hypothetical protein
MRSDGIGALESGRFESHLKGFVSVVPFPNAVTDKGCRLESIIGTPKGEVTYIQGSGFEPNQELTMDGESYPAKNSRMVAAFVSKIDSMTTLPLESITATEIVA